MVNKKEYIKSYAVFKRLPSVLKRIEEMEKKMLKLQKNS